MTLIRIGITGGIATGKSTVARIFKKLGAELIDADRISHQVLRFGTPAYSKIVKQFGRGILKRNGDIDRRKLGRLVFGDPVQRKKLNAIVHPEFRKVMRIKEKEIRQRRGDSKIVVYDVPLLIETGLHLRMNRVVLVRLSKKKQVERLSLRNGLAKSESLKRIAAQLPERHKTKFAHYFIKGDETPENRLIKVEYIYRQVKREFLIKDS